MKDILGLMKQAQALQEKMQAMQAEVAALEVEGSAGGGMVTVRLNGKGVMTGLTIDASLMKEEDAGMVEDLIVAAHNSAKEKADAALAQKTREMTAGLPLPPGMKLPF
jgi:DNA-binding YbaB/EbfC family protein